MSTGTQHLRTPIVSPKGITEIADGVWVIPDSDHTPLVPNIGIVVGGRATLVIDTGFGADNARAVMQEARRLSAGRPVYLTHTHCHPEHGFGANVVAGEVTIVYNEAQWNELQEKGHVLLHMFRNQIPSLAPMLDGVEFVRPQLLYAGSLKLDLGDGQIVEFREFGGAHSRGDQAILVRKSQVVLFSRFHSVASAGLICRSSSRMTRLSKILKVILVSGSEVLMCGSNFWTSAACSTTRSLLPAGAAAQQSAAKNTTKTRIVDPR